MDLVEAVTSVVWLKKDKRNIATIRLLLSFVYSAAICTLHITYHHAGADHCFQYDWNRFPSPHDQTRASSQRNHIAYTVSELFLELFLYFDLSKNAGYTSPCMDPIPCNLFIRKGIVLISKFRYWNRYWKEMKLQPSWCTLFRLKDSKMW